MAVVRICPTLWPLSLGLVLLALPLSAEQLLVQANPLSLEWLSVPDATKTLMRSGFDFNDGNYDSGNLVRIEPSGMNFSNRESAWVLFETKDQGVLTSIWFTGKSKQGQAYLGGRLNFYFDGEPQPRISGRLPELFESGQIFPKGLAEKSSGGWVSYVPIYFRSLKITLDQHEDSFAHRKNGRNENIPHLYHQFTWQKLAGPVHSSTVADLKAAPVFAPLAEPVRPAEQTFRLPAHGKTTIASIVGKGILTSLRLNFGQTPADELRLRITADGKNCVDLKVSEFWGFSRQARPKARFQSLLLGVDDAGRYYSRWPMPHRERLEIALENPGPDCEVSVETVHQPNWPTPEHFYFHATRIADQTVAGRDIRLLAAKGRGHYVGCILELANKTLEGDDRFYVDDEPFPPAWHGTGTEDYFRCGWYFFGGPLSRPLYGLLDGGTPKIAYRFHLADRVNFTKSVVIGFEHGHQNEYQGPYQGTVFWYAQGD